jgi:4-carboxymuconolactone decarboxylase
METNMPSDIDPQSGFRLPLPRREDLDEAGRSAYDRAITPGRTIAGLQGPAGVQLYSPKIASHVAAINQYLRFEAGFTARTCEIAILATAREMDSQFEWVAHEPEALKQGVPQTVIDVIKHRGSTLGLDDTDAVVIELGRELWRDHKVSSTNLRQGQSFVWTAHPYRPSPADGQLRGHGGVARRGRHATACGQATVAADPVSIWRRRLNKSRYCKNISWLRPIRFLLGINLKTARSLGIDVPPGLPLRAGEVIE